MRETERELIWLSVEQIVLGLIEARGESRNSMGPRLGYSRNHLGRHLRTASERENVPRVEPAFDLAFEVAERLGVRPPSLLASFACDAPEVLLELLPCPSDKEQDLEMLEAISTLGLHMPRPSTERFLPWKDRMSPDSEFAAIYKDLELLEEQRHHDPEAVEATCRTAVLEATRESPLLRPAEALRLTGLIGIWGTLQRRAQRTAHAREALRHSILFARRLADLSAYAHQLQRSAYVLLDLKAVDLAISTMEEAITRYQADGNEQGTAKALIDRAVLAFHQSDYGYAELLYRRGLAILPSNRCSAYRLGAIQGIATCRELLGDVEGALSALATAADARVPCHPRDQGAILYVAANIERRLMRYAEAEKKYWQALSLFSEASDADAVLRACLDLTLCLIGTGDFESLPRLKDLAQKHIAGLRHRKALQNAFEQFLRELSRGQPKERAIRHMRVALTQRGDRR